MGGLCRPHQPGLLDKDTHALATPGLGRLMSHHPGGMVASCPTSVVPTPLCIPCGQAMAPHSFLWPCLHRAPSPRPTPMLAAPGFRISPVAVRAALGCGPGPLLN